MTKKQFVRGAFIVMGILLIVGLILIFSATSVGQNAGTIAIQSQGGTMDTSSYERIINMTTTQYLLTGTILSLLGGVGILLSGYAYYIQLEA